MLLLVLITTYSILILYQTKHTFATYHINQDMNLFYGEKYDRDII